MADSEEFPDDVPVADAVEQQRPTADPTTDDEAPEEAVAEVPLETPDSDWQEQQETVVTDPELDEFDRG
jgi:hypothetical protein